MIVIRDAIIKKCSGLARWQKSIVLQHIECCGPGLMCVHHDFGTRYPVQWRVNALSGEFDYAVTLEGFALIIEDNNVTGASL